MRLYDGVIKEALTLLSSQKGVSLPFKEGWPLADAHAMILRSDMAYELGGEGLPALGLTLTTTNEELLIEDGLTLIGDDLSSIKRDNPYARVTLLLTDENSSGEGNELYRKIRAIEAIRFNFYPYGFMNRISTSRGVESVRVSKEAIKRGISFASIGTLFNSLYKTKAKAKIVHTFYITEPSFDYSSLSVLVKESEEITKTIDHILKNVTMDCKSCSLSSVCSEVEELRKLHFSLERRGNQL